MGGGWGDQGRQKVRPMWSLRLGEEMDGRAWGGEGMFDMKKSIVDWNRLLCHVELVCGNLEIANSVSLLEERRMMRASEFMLKSPPMMTVWDCWWLKRREKRSWSTSSLRDLWDKQGI